MKNESWNLLFRTSAPLCCPRYRYPSAMACECVGSCRCAFSWRELAEKHAEEAAHWRRLSRWAARAGGEVVGRWPQDLPPDFFDDPEATPTKCACVGGCSCKRYPGEKRRRRY